jgi:hypothetical protein
LIDGLPLIVSQVKHARQAISIFDAIAKLPLPIVPFSVGRFRERDSANGFGSLADDKPIMRVIVRLIEQSNAVHMAIAVAVGMTLGAMAIAIAVGVAIGIAVGPAIAVAVLRMPIGLWD